MVDATEPSLFHHHGSAACHQRLQRGRSVAEHERSNSHPKRGRSRSHRHREALPAGRYTRAGFVPAITFELDGSWQAVQLANGFFDVQQDPGSQDVIAVQFARPIGIFGGSGLSDPAGADAAMDALRTNTGLEVVESSDSRIGGLDGAQVTVENAGESHASVMQVPPGALGIDPDAACGSRSSMRMTACWRSWSVDPSQAGTRRWRPPSRCWNRSASVHSPDTLVWSADQTTALRWCAGSRCRQSAQTVGACPPGKEQG